MLTFVVMSDLHLGPEGAAVNGLDTGARLSAAVESVNAEYPDAAFVLLAGDLTDEGQPEAYAHLAKRLEPLRAPVHLALGNHDRRPVFLECMPDAVTDADGFVQFVIDAGGYRVVVLDSSEPGLVHGVLCARRLAWLEARLDEAQDRPVIVVVHHHANPLRMPVDRIPLLEPEKLLASLGRHPDVRMVIAGHVHRATAACWRGVPFVTLSGNHYDVSPWVTGAPGRQKVWEGPAQYAVVHADADGVLVHFHDYINRHIELADGLFPWRKEQA